MDDLLAIFARCRLVLSSVRELNIGKVPKGFATEKIEINAAKISPIFPDKTSEKKLLITKSSILNCHPVVSKDSLL